jgi:peptidoglycan/xylan/chitin deacetylase (PgdA/CDA1 family)
MILYFTVTASVLLGGIALFVSIYVVYSAVQEYRSDRVPALLYHRLISKDHAPVSKPRSFDRSYVTYDTVFAKQMAYLHGKRYSTISLDEFLAYREGRSPLPPKPIMITFDDGFASNYHYAFPVLTKYQMTATIFATPDPTCDNFQKYASTDKALTPEQMREMSKDRIFIHSHGMTHRYLSELVPAMIRWELVESKKALERILGTPVCYLAIPSGAYNRTVRKLAKETGYRAVFCMLKGTNNRNSDPYALRRLVVGQDLTIEDFGRMLSPPVALYMRLESALQYALLQLLGPGKLDALRDLIYTSRFGSIVTRGQRLRYLVSAIAALLTILSAGIVLVLHRSF